MKAKATLKQIAKELGVSVSTVSKALSDSQEISQATKDKIKEFVDPDDYTLKFYVNQQKVEDIRNYVVQEDDRILISYGDEDQEAIDKQLAELNAQTINRL